MVMQKFSNLVIGSLFLDSIKYFAVDICVIDNFANVLFFCQYTHFNTFVKGIRKGKSAWAARKVQSCYTNMRRHERVL